jgi:methionyl aminopeptidase
MIRLYDLPKGASQVSKNLFEFIKKHISNEEYLLELEKSPHSCLIEEANGYNFIHEKNADGVEFGRATCISYDEELTHGRGNTKDSWQVKKLDMGVYVDYPDGSRFNFDCAHTIISELATQETKDAYNASITAWNKIIDQIVSGSPQTIKDLSAIIFENICNSGLYPLVDYCGHGIGKSLHEEPLIPNKPMKHIRHQDSKLMDGMSFCLEPMMATAKTSLYTMPDGWTVRAEDGVMTFHYEHQFYVKNGKVHLLKDLGEKK